MPLHVLYHKGWLPRKWKILLSRGKMMIDGRKRPVNESSWWISSLFEINLETLTIFCRPLLEEAISSLTFDPPCNFWKEIRPKKIVFFYQLILSQHTNRMKESTDVGTEKRKKIQAVQLGIEPRA